MMRDSYLPDNEPRDILWSLEELAAKKLPHAPTFRKAADEIRRLRTENGKLLAALNEARVKALGEGFDIAIKFNGMPRSEIAQAFEHAKTAALKETGDE